MTSQHSPGRPQRQARRRFAGAAASLAASLVAASCLAFAEQADERLPCEHDNLPLEKLRECTNEISKPGLTAADRGNIYMARGAAWMREDEPAAAAAEFSRAIAADPLNIAAITGRARAYSALGKHDLAAADWTLVVALQPEKSDGYTQRAASRLAAGMPTDALADRWGDKQMAIDNYRLVVKFNARYWKAYKALHRLGADHYFGQKE